MLSSLSSTFGITVERGTTGEIFVSTLGANPEPEDLIEEMTRVWVTAIPVTRVEVLTPGLPEEIRDGLARRVDVVVHPMTGEP